MFVVIRVSRLTVLCGSARARRRTAPFRFEILNLQVRLQYQIRSSAPRLLSCPPMCLADAYYILKSHEHANYLRCAQGVGKVIDSKQNKPFPPLQWIPMRLCASIHGIQKKSRHQHSGDRSNPAQSCTILHPIQCNLSFPIRWHNL